MSKVPDGAGIFNGKLPGVKRTEWAVPMCELRKPASSALWQFREGPTDVMAAIERSARYRNGSRTCIQAGGNLGFWPVVLANYFDMVVTAEPDPLNMECLIENIVGCDNIFAFDCAFGEKEGHCAMYRDEQYVENCVASRPVDGNDVVVMPIDKLQLGEVDLLWLDVEGYELAALNGAVDTINRCRPVIGIEEKSHWKRYPGGNPRDWLLQHGYRLIGQVSKLDYMYAPEERA